MLTKQSEGPNNFSGIATSDYSSDQSWLSFGPELMIFYFFIVKKCHLHSINQFIINSMECNSLYI